jgi:hypothetical protein
MAVHFEVEVTEPGDTVHGGEMRDIDGVFEHFLRMRPEPPPRGLGRVERERGVVALGYLGQFPFRLRRIGGVPDEDRARTFHRRPRPQPRGPVDRLRVGNLDV